MSKQAGDMPERIARPVSVARLFLDYLRLEKVDRIFGYPGTALQYVLNELRLSDDIEFVICRQETGAAYIADAYSRITGDLGAVLVTTGPGATNALTGVMNAQSINSSVLAVSAEVPRRYFGRSALQEGVDGSLDVSAIYRAACQYSAVITDGSNFEELMRQALREAMSVPRRAAHLSLPEDVSAQTIETPRLPLSPAAYRATPASCPEGAAARVLDVLCTASLPLLWLGNGCRRVLFAGSRTPPDDAAAINRRRERFYGFVREFALPVMTTGDGKGLFPESDALSLRNFGLGGSPWPAAYTVPAETAPELGLTYDALCVLGSSLSQLGTSSWAKTMVPEGPFIQVDADQSVIGRGYTVTDGIVAEIGAFLDALLDEAEQREAPPESRERRRRYLEAVKRIPYPAKNPQAQLLVAVANAIPSPAHVFVDACSADFLALMYFVVDYPVEMHNSLVQGPIGTAVAGVVGAALATDAPCIAICGDGGFMMQGSEVNTAAQHRVGALWIVFQNHELGTVVQKMERDFPQSGEASWEKLLSIGEADLVKFAEGLGAHAQRVDDVAAVGPAVTAALNRAKSECRPQVIVIPTKVYALPETSLDGLP